MQVPAVCRASYSWQRQPAPAPAASAAAGRQQAGLLTSHRTGPACDGHTVPQPPKSCSLLQDEQRPSGRHGQQWAAKKPFAGFICCCFCLHPCTEPRPRWCSGRGSNTSFLSPEVLPAHLLGSYLRFSQPQSRPAIS